MSKKVSGWPLIAPKELPEGLPAIEAGDAGKVLTASENGPEWAEASGGGATFVPITMNEAGTMYTAEASYDDVADNIYNGKMVIFMESGVRDAMLGIVTDLSVRTNQFRVSVGFSAGSLTFTAASSTDPLTASTVG